MTSKSIITLFAATVAILFLTVAPVDAEAYYFETIEHEDENHLESYENIDFTPSYENGYLEIIFGENPDMNASNENFMVMVTLDNQLPPFFLQPYQYEDELEIGIFGIDSEEGEPIVQLYILSADPPNPPEAHIGWEFNLFWTPEDEGGYLAPIPVAAVEEVEKSSGGCADCTAPTIGLNSVYNRVVDNGFSYNGNTVQVEKWHTPFPLITAQVGEMNRVEIIAYDNQGINNMKAVEFGLGAKEIGEPRNDLEVLIEVNLDMSSNNFAIDEVIIKDRDNLIETFSVFAAIEKVKCLDISADERCLKVILEYSYREPTLYNIMVVNVQDKPGNSQNFWLNDGVEVVGESMNIPPTYIIQNRQTAQQTEDLTLTLTRTDKVDHIWEDKYGIEYLQVSKDRFDRLTPQAPIECTDKPLSEMMVPNRNNCNFRATMISLWS